MPHSTDPEHIAVSKSKGIKIDWKDRHRSEYALQYLRDKCPCATCTGVHGTPPAATTAQSGNPFQMYKPALKILSIEPVGNYAVRINWNDGHNTGIYSWDYLYELGEHHDAYWQQYLERLQAAGASRDPAPKG